MNGSVPYLLHKERNVVGCEYEALAHDTLWTIVEGSRAICTHRQLLRND
jgi:hypothetical protein